MTLVLDSLAAAAPERAVAGTGALVEEFLRGRAATTTAAYRASLARFATFVGVEGIADAARVLLSDGPGPANRLLLRYRAALLASGAAPTTVNVRLSAVRSLVAFARLVGVVDWTPSVRGVRSLPTRDVRGPSLGSVRRILAETAESASPKARRDLGVLRLLVDLALRRGEVVSLDVEHVDLAAGVVRVLGKGHLERVPLTLPVPTQAALAAWLGVRGGESGPLFVCLRRGGGMRRDQDGHLRRISGADVFRLVRAASAAVGVDAVRPHALRHFSVTAALTATGGDLRRVRAFSRHVDVRTVLRYDDARVDAAGDVARLVAAQADVPIRGASAD